MISHGDNFQAEPSWDVIIVGAGAAGCALAGRPSEISEKRVLLIEAGPDFPADQEACRHPRSVRFLARQFPLLLAEI